MSRAGEARHTELIRKLGFGTQLSSLACTSTRIGALPKCTSCLRPPFPRIMARGFAHRRFAAHGLLNEANWTALSRVVVCHVASINFDRVFRAADGSSPSVRSGISFGTSSNPLAIDREPVICATRSSK
jgi:hypothetical protein